MSLSARNFTKDHLISLSDICNSPAELVDKVRNTPHAATLVDYCQRAASDKDLSDSTRYTALAVSTAIRANIPLQEAWVKIVSKTYPDLKDRNLDTYLEVCQQARFAAVTGGKTYKIGTKVISADLARQEAENGIRLNDEWIGFHSTVICLLENMTRWHISQYELDAAPKDFLLARKLLHIQIHSLFEKSRESLDSTVRMDLKGRFPFAHAELDRSCISPFSYLEAGVTRYIFNADDKVNIDLIFKTATLSFQKIGHKYPHLAAYAVMVNILVTVVNTVCAKVIETLQSKVTYKPSEAHVLFRKDWKPIAEQSVKLTKSLKQHFVHTDCMYFDLYQQQMASFISKIKKDYPSTITKNADVEIMRYYGDMALAAISLRLRSNAVVPFSWVKDVLFVLGGPTKARLFFQEMRTASFFRKMPVDDIDDAVDHLADYFLPRQSIQLERNEEDKLVVAVYEEGEKAEQALKRYPTIMEFRRNLIGNFAPEYEHTPTMTQRMRDHYWLWLFQHPGQSLLPEQLASMYNCLGESLRAVDRMLVSMGDIAKSSRTVLRRLRKADMEPLGQQSLVMHYRDRGFKIPEGFEGIFFNELVACTQKS